MGSCHSINILLYHQNSIHTKNECFICWEETSEIYVKCSICKIMLHENCELRYNNKVKSAQCPNCKRKKVLYLYKND